MRENGPISALVRVNQSNPIVPTSGRLSLADIHQAIPQGGATVMGDQIAGLTRDYNLPGVSRFTSPENSAADYADVAPEVYHRLAAYQVPPYVPILGLYEVVSADYNVLGAYELLRGGLAAVEALGRNEQNSYIGFTDATAGTIRFAGFSSPNLIAGFQVDWGIPVLSAQPLEIGIQTFYWKDAFGWGSVDRNLVLRVNDINGSTFGGKFQILFAHRQTTATSCGLNDPYAGGMQMAIFQPAVVPVSQTPGTAAPDRFPPLYINSTLSDATPSILLSVPPPIASAFSARVRLLTAASPQVALTRDRLCLNGASQYLMRNGGMSQNVP